MFLEEIKRAFSRMSFKLMILVGCAFCIKSLIDANLFKSSSEELISQYLGGYINTSFSNFIFFKANPLGNFFIIIMPILCAFSFSDSYIEDRKSGIIENIYTRKSKIRYLINKYLVNFIVSGIAFAVPLLFDYLLCIMLMPSINSDPVLTGKIISRGGLFSDLFYSKPNLYILMWIVIYFLFAGAFASIALCSSKFIKNKYVVIFVPFILNFIITMLCERTDSLKFAPVNFLYCFTQNSFIIILSEFIIISIITFGLFCFIGVKNDVYKMD